MFNDSIMKYKHIPDRGPADHSHGRKTIIENLMSALEHHRDKNDGTTFLIQGPPGAGKTALLHKLSKLAEAKGWKIAKIKSIDFYTPVSMAQLLGMSYAISN